MTVHTINDKASFQGIAHRPRFHSAPRTAPEALPFDADGATPACRLCKNSKTVHDLQGRKIPCLCVEDYEEFAPGVIAENAAWLMGQEPFDRDAYDEAARMVP